MAKFLKETLGHPTHSSAAKSSTSPGDRFRCSKVLRRVFTNLGRTQGNMIPTNSQTNAEFHTAFSRFEKKKTEDIMNQSIALIASLFKQKPSCFSKRVRPLRPLPRPTTFRCHLPPPLPPQTNWLLLCTRKWKSQINPQLYPLLSEETKNK